MSQDLRTGVVTFLFTDIVGSTRLWDRATEQMRVAVERHDALGRAAIEENHGSVVKHTGDGFHAAFDDPLDALTASLAFLRAIADLPAASGLALEVRCGMHAGTVERRDNDYFGPAVNHAQRVMDAAHGGQILLSQGVANLVEDRLPAGVTLRDLGAVRLRDLTRAKHVFQIVHPRLRQQFPALRSLEATPNNLPQQVTSFIGRERELLELSQLLPNARLLTLVGAGGIGKTRLMLQLAADLVDKYPDGVWYVDLGAIDDPALVVNALALVLGLAEVAGTPLIETICLHMKSRRVLVLLDGCEHLLGACARLADALLRASAGIAIVATSREPLRTAGEQTAMLVPLSLPEPTANLGTFLRADAVRLFVERSRSRQPDFAVSEQNAPAVAQICTRLDGIPLALELAAARVGALPLEVIARRLDDRFSLLKSGDRAAMPRQQTLKALIDWSYDLLETPEKHLFARLSVFAAGWTLDAAEAVCADATLPRSDILNLLDQLVQKSLVSWHEHEDRYWFLETIHDYAEGQLRQSGETDGLRDRHHRYYLALAEAAEPALRKRKVELPWLRSLETEHANLKAALLWSLERSDLAADALRMCGALGRFWRVRGHWREGRDWCFAALEKDAGAAPKDVRADALMTAGMMNFWLGETAAAEGLVETALALAREGGNRNLEARALNNLSNLVSDRGDFARAHSLLDEAVAINHELGNREGECINMINIGVHFIDQGQLASAQAPLERSLALSREIGSDSLEAFALGGMGRLAEQRGDCGQARTLSAEALAIFRGLNSLAEEVEQTLALARVCIASGERAAAARYLAEALGTSRGLGHRSIVQCLDAMIGLAVKVVAYQKAAIFRGACQSLREIIGVLAAPSEAERSERYCSECRAAIGDAAFAAGEAAGRALSSESVIAIGLAWLGSIAQVEPKPSIDAAVNASEGSVTPGCRLACG
jgi:predicted ATPase/class 3 adenylate cyclase/Tfp pilus assembly protein PilF